MNYPIARSLAELVYTLVFVMGIGLVAANRLQAQAAPVREPLWPGARAAVPFTAPDEEFLDELQRASFRYFEEQAHPETGLVRDRTRTDGSPSPSKASISATGFGLAGWAIATKRGWVTREVALERVRRTLRFLVHDAPRHRGFFYHFMELDTGAHAWECELSSIDTALLLTGAIVAREFFEDPEVTSLVNRLYGDADWQWFLNEGDITALGWKDEVGFSRYRWSSYSEHMMIPLLGLGSPQPEHALAPAAWRAWAREPVGSHGGWTYLQGGPLFLHQFTHAYFDFRGVRDAFADYFHNSVLATLAQRQMCMDLRHEFPAWGERLWGVTASDSATGYKGWGLPPRTLKDNALDGTIVPCAAGGSIPFAPYETMLTLRHIRMAYGDRVWGRYGFADAFNPHTGWVNEDVIGIDVGITLLMAENARSGLVWALFMQAPEARRAMELAGFLSTERD
ncbi:MAG TPA: glucoamylase family protein, partial [Candidatus Synoicihabitans sp.]|nr:glucoamylase family protein [Candidatus Synoicihabitans sp.]